MAPSDTADGGNGLFQALVSALPLLARFTSGFSTVLSLSDWRRKTVDGDGNDLTEYVVENCEGFEEATKSTSPLLVPSKVNSGVLNLFLTLGDCLLVLNNAGSVELVDRLKIIFEEAIPMVARVAGGEAVLFDREGIRFSTVQPDGRESSRGLGQFTYLGKRAMELGRPVIGPSLLENGALAVRIPITHEFGIGVNNVVSVKQKKLLAASSSQERARYTFSNIIGNSDSLQECIQRAIRVSDTNSTVLVHGETGTGKELFVQSIHNASQRSRGPFIALNCGAIPPSLVESELFGYEPGAFTGAQKQGQPGLFEQASGGTMFLDEVSEMSLELQSRLLRVLQERELVRIGGKKMVPLNVRVISSTNRDLWKMVASGKFRQDLYYRLNVVELHVPPLRQRPQDISLLVRQFIDQFRANFGSFVKDISEEALHCLLSYSWPGNVRELQNCIERIMNFATHEIICIEDIPAIIRKGQGTGQPHMEKFPAKDPRLEPAITEPASTYDSWSKPGTNLDNVSLNQSASLKGPTQAVERTVILRALEKSAYNRRRAAESLGISTTTLWRKMKRLGIPCGR